MMLTDLQSYPIQSIKRDSVADKKIKQEIIWSDTGEEDELSFMETFGFPDLKEIKASLKGAGYNQKQINDLISGLKTLPEYKRG